MLANWPPQGQGCGRLLPDKSQRSYETATARLPFGCRIYGLLGERHVRGPLGRCRICGKKASYATLTADASNILPNSAEILAASAGRMTSRADSPQMRPMRKRGRCVNAGRCLLGFGLILCRISGIGYICETNPISRIIKLSI